MQCIHLSSNLRKSQHSIRILFQSPPRISISDLIVQLIRDLVAGSTQGFEGLMWGLQRAERISRFGRDLRFLPDPEIGQNRR